MADAPQAQGDVRDFLELDVVLRSRSLYRAGLKLNTAPKARAGGAELELHLREACTRQDSTHTYGSRASVPRGDCTLHGGPGL